MSILLRSLFRNANLVKWSFNEAGGSSSLVFNVQDSDLQVQCSRSLNTGMTFIRKFDPSPSKTQPFRIKKDDKSADNLAVFNNGQWIGDSSRRSDIVASDGYYRNDWKNRNEHSQQAEGEKEEFRKCKFNFDYIHVRLIETVGVLGTVVAVGIDVRTRYYKECIPQPRFGIYEFCHDHHHNPNSFPLTNDEHQTSRNSNNGSSNLLSRALDYVEDTIAKQKCMQRNNYLATTKYCGYSPFSSNIFDYLFYQYVVKPFNCNIVSPKRAAAKPKADFDHLDESPLHNDGKVEFSEVLERDYIDGCDEPSVSPNLFDSGYVSDVHSSCACGENVNHNLAQARQRKNAICYHHEQNETTIEDQTADVKLEDIEETEEFQLSQRVDKEEEQTKSSTSSAFQKVDDDIAAVFRMASIEYANQLSNLVAISLMNGQKPTEAMQYWSNSENSSRALFNMGVAYESGRYAKNAQPDLDKAHDCYALAASLGHRDALFNLALFYLYGKGKVEADLEKGIHFLEVAANRGVKVAKNFCHQLRIQQIKEDFSRKPSHVNNIKGRPLRTSMIRPSPSLFGTAATRLKSKQHSSEQGTTLKRNHSAPNLYSLSKSSPNMIAM